MPVAAPAVAHKVAVLAGELPVATQAGWRAVMRAESRAAAQVETPAEWQVETRAALAAA